MEKPFQTSNLSPYNLWHSLRYSTIGWTTKTTTICRSKNVARCRTFISHIRIINSTFTRIVYLFFKLCGNFDSFNSETDSQSSLSFQFRFSTHMVWTKTRTRINIQHSNWEKHSKWCILNLNPTQNHNRCLPHHTRYTYPKHHVDKIEDSIGMFGNFAMLTVHREQL